MENWAAHVERESSRYRDGLDRLPIEANARQKQLVRIANAAAGCALVCLMTGDRRAAAGWLSLAAERYRQSYADAPPGSWGRLIGAVKARLLAGDAERVQDDARWALAQSPQASGSPIGVYAAALAALALGRDAEAAALAEELKRVPDTHFPQAVALALDGLAHSDPRRYEEGLRRVLQSFEARESHLEDVPVADTVLVLEVLAETRGIAVRLTSTLLPEGAQSDGQQGRAGGLRGAIDPPSS